MTNAPKPLLGISNAIVDILAHVEHSMLDTLGAPAGSMTLIDRQRAVEVHELMPETINSAGGSVANSIACLASLGGSCAYIGRVADDPLGNTFSEDMLALGIDMRLAPETRHAPTARCHVFVTPDGERTMQTYLGACVEIATSDINQRTIGDPSIILLEGYVWDTPEGPDAMREAVRLGKKSGARIALSLSDSFCVERHQQTFAEMVSQHADIVIGNEAETKQLFETESLETACDAARDSGRLFVLTRSENGSIIIEGDQRHDQPADLSQPLVDATGAGDAYVAGFLFGLQHDWSHADSAMLATRCATLAIRHFGARPKPDALRALIS